VWTVSSSSVDKVPFLYPCLSYLLCYWENRWKLVKTCISEIIVLSLTIHYGPGPWHLSPVLVVVRSSFMLSNGTRFIHPPPPPPRKLKPVNQTFPSFLLVSSFTYFAFTRRLWVSSLWQWGPRLSSSHQWFWTILIRNCALEVRVSFKANSKKACVI